jgi:hypothetical protein
MVMGVTVKPHNTTRIAAQEGQVGHTLNVVGPSGTIVLRGLSAGPGVPCAANPPQPRSVDGDARGGRPGLHRGASHVRIRESFVVSEGTRSETRFRWQPWALVATASCLERRFLVARVMGREPD